MTEADSPQKDIPKHSKKKTLLVIFGSVVVLGIAAIWIYILLSPTQYDETKSFSFDIGVESVDEASDVLSDSNPSSLEDIYQAIDDSRASNEAAFSPSPSSSFAQYPDEILPCTKSGDNLLVLVNKKYKLPETYEPSDLVDIGNSGIRSTRSGMQVRNIIVPDLTALVVAISAKGIDIAALSAYRDYETQQNTYNYWVSYNGGDTAAADMISARPGHSQHQLGTTIDFTTSEISDQLGQHFANTAAGQWLSSHAWEYGFALAYPAGWESTTGYNYEPWHFRYIGVENAESWHSSGEILELWLHNQ